MAASILFLFLGLLVRTDASVCDEEGGATEGCLMQTTSIDVQAHRFGPHRQDFDPSTAIWATRDDGRLHLKVFLECLCPASQYFMQHSYIPLMKDPETRKFMDIKLYFNTNAVKMGDKISCQHGERECAVNLVLMCASDQLDTGAFASFLECAFPSFRGDVQVGAGCLNESVFTSINDCASSEEGIKIREQALDWYPHERAYAPWVVKSDGDSLQHWKQGEADLVKYMCQFIPVTEKPGICDPKISVVQEMSVKPMPRFSQFSQNSNKGKVRVRVYFESMCPASQQFVKEQYVPLMEREEFKDLLDFNAVPYTNAHLKLKDGVLDLDCQHGPDECAANQRVVCANKLLSASQVVDFLGCMEPFPAASHFDDKLSGCLDADAYEVVESCATNDDIAREVRLEAHERMPDGRRYCPWVMINGKHSTDAEGDLEAVVCKSLEPSLRPQACQGSVWKSQ